MATTKQWQPSPTQQKVIDFLKSHTDRAYTLAEISEAVGVELKTGTTNTLLTKGIMKCNKNALIRVCPCCGHKTPISTYELVSD